MSYEPDQLLHVALELPDWERDAICRRLGERCAVIRCAGRWSNWFVPMFVTGLLAVLAGVLVAVLGGPFWLAALLLPAGMTAAGLPAIKIWQLTWRMLDIAVAATVCVARHRSHGGNETLDQV